jgi:hypothetical protein
VSFRGDPCLVELPVAQHRHLNSDKQHFLLAFCIMVVAVPDSGWGVQL